LDEGLRSILESVEVLALAKTGRLSDTSMEISCTIRGQVINFGKIPQLESELKKLFVPSRRINDCGLEISDNQITGCGNVSFLLRCHKASGG